MGTHKLLTGLFFCLLGAIATGCETAAQNQQPPQGSGNAARSAASATEDPSWKRVEPLYKCVFKNGKVEDGDELKTEEIAAIMDVTPRANGRKSLLNEFLDCAVGEVDENNHELRQLRAHITVALLATYGAYNIAFKEYDERETNAASLIARIEIAEEKLLSASATVTGNADAGKSHRPTVEILHRAAAVFDVSVEAQKPTIKRLRGFFRRVISVVSGGVAGATDLIKDALDGIKKMAEIKIWGDAYRHDTRNFLKQFEPTDRGGKGETLKKEHFQMWNTDIEAACKTLAQIAGVNQHCIPAKYK